GHGRCGVPQCDPLPGKCFHKTFRDRLYWFCEGPIDWQQAEARCNEEPGRALAKVDDRLESEWLGSVMGDSWVGGNTLGDESTWRWSRHATRNGPIFRADGLPIPGKYENWAAGSPETERCLALGADGKWSDESCSAQRGFVCEQPLLRLPEPIVPPCACEFFPGLSCDDCHHDNGGGTEGCIPGDVEWPKLPCLPMESEDDCAERNKNAVIDQAQACFDNCQVEGANGCAASCTGFATPPLEGESCDDFSPTSRATCELVPGSADPQAPRCSVLSPGCPDGLLCGRGVECAAMDANNHATPCEDDSNCNTAAGQYCGQEIQVCMDPNRKGACDGAVNGICPGYCFGFLGCGTPDPHCAGLDDRDLLDRCNDTLICPDDDTIDLNTDPLADPESNLSEQEFVPNDFFPPNEPSTPPGEFPSAKPPGCGGDNEAACTFPVGGSHPWCKYGVDPDQQPVNRGVSDTEPPFTDSQGRDKGGRGGSAGPISFGFDPNLSINYDLGNPLPLGDSEFKADARALATADAHFDLFGINGDVNILDAFGIVTADRCGVAADAQLKLFGHDFLPVIIGDSAYDKLKNASTSQEFRDKCTKGIEDFKKVANRATKALRDAQELIRQEKELVAKGQRFSPDLCHQLLELGEGVPSDFPSAALPFQGCDGLSPEDTINLFIRYYRQKVYALIPEQRRLIDDNLPVLAPINIDFLESVDAVDDVNEARRETQQIANINFAIGPVPMNLTIEAFVQYGLAGNLGLTLAPGKLVDAYHEDGDGEIAKVDASITPFAGAGVTLFVGVGFDWGALSAKLGILGDVSLGLVSMSIYAAAGLRVKSEFDDRGLPSDIREMLA
ncbi:MAG TPA: C-type lectin domain-containing protein, partial [Polyangiaceae bacterium]|nr:C-type lectin domain-containing protein [Polyangiaceae bacterium]